MTRPELAVGPRGFVPALIVFDKDGTLIDFEAMWGGWVEELTSLSMTIDNALTC